MTTILDIVFHLQKSSEQEISKETPTTLFQGQLAESNKLEDYSTKMQCSASDTVYTNDTDAIASYDTVTA